jgi:hypothetical protein
LRQATNSWQKAAIMTHIPLSARSSQEIRAQAETYLRMAQSARTADAKRGLEAVAARFAAIAARREAEGNPQASQERSAMSAEAGPR